MKKLIMISLILAGCTTIKVEAPKGTVNISADKQVTTSPSIKADGNTVPVTP